jgi:AraC-like DNA-binding protein
VYFAPDLIKLGSTKVLAVPGLVREMVVYASRWPIDRRSSDAMADTFFETLAYLVGELGEHPYSLHLPTPTDRVVCDAVGFTHAHAGTARESDVCEAIGVSARTLRRHFQSDLDMSWAHYARQYRLLSAMAMLAQPEPSVLLVAQQVGFDSPSAFNRAFRHVIGESPTEYRRRVSAPTSSSRG